MGNTITDTPRAWVGCLACYNGGDLVGDWVDGEDAAEYVPCTRVEYGSPHEEWWVMDHECLPIMSGECSPCEFTEATNWYLEVLEDVGMGYEDEVRAWLTTVEDWRNTEVSQFHDQYAGQANNSRDWAYDRWFDCADPDEQAIQDRWPFNCVDWEHAATELLHTHNEVRYNHTSYFFTA